MSDVVQIALEEDEIKRLWSAFRASPSSNSSIALLQSAFAFDYSTEDLAALGIKIGQLSSYIQQT